MGTQTAPSPYVSDAETHRTEAASGSVWRYRHDGAGRITTEVAPDGNMLSRVLSDGELASVTDRRESTVSFERDGLNNVSRVTHARGTRSATYVPGTDRVATATASWGTRRRSSTTRTATL